MDTIQIWFIIETIHFLLGTIGCAFMPDTVMNTYTLYPKVYPNEKAYEMIDVLTSFYLAILVLSIISIFYVNIAICTCTVLSVFYMSLLCRDLYSWIKIGFKSNMKNKYLDTSIHLIFGSVAIFFLMGHLGLLPKDSN